MHHEIKQKPKAGYHIEDINRNVNPRPITDKEDYQGSGKLGGKVAIITGGDSGIGEATAIMFAKEGADVVITYYHNEAEDAQHVTQVIESLGQKALALAGDVGEPEFARKVVSETVAVFGKVDILVNNAAEQHTQDSITNITPEQLERTFKTNIFSMFYFVQEALPYMGEGSTIINTSSVTAYRGNDSLIDYASTKGAIVSFTRSLSQNKEILKRKIRVNSVAPGPIWTPLIPATVDDAEFGTWGIDTPLGRGGQPFEVAPAFVYLASDDSTYVSGQVMHVNGGEVING